MVESLLCRQEGLNLDSQQPSTPVRTYNPSAEGWSLVVTCVYSAGQSNPIRELQLSQKLDEEESRHRSPASSHAPTHTPTH